MALRLLSRRDYTEAELRTKLEERGYPQDPLDDTIRQLTERGALNDPRVAAAHARTSAIVKGRGRHRVLRELQARGLSRDVIDEAMASLPAGSEAKAIRRILERKHWPARPSLQLRRRMFQHLLRRGFPADAIRRALGSGVEDDPSGE